MYFLGKLLFLIEWSPTGIIKEGRGIRQGDSLSPLLFIIVIEYLSRLIQNVVDGRRMDLYTLGGVRVESLLAFADDIVFFIRASTKSFRTLKELLDETEGDCLEHTNTSREEGGAGMKDFKEIQLPNIICRTGRLWGGDSI